MNDSQKFIDKDISLRNSYLLESQSLEEDTDLKTKYKTFLWFLNYGKIFVTRLTKDLIISLASYVYSGQLLPKHITDLMHTQKILQAERELLTVTYSRYKFIKDIFVIQQMNINRAQSL